MTLRDSLHGRPANSPSWCLAVFAEREGAMCCDKIQKGVARKRSAHTKEPRHACCAYVVTSRHEPSCQGHLCGDLCGYLPIALVPRCWCHFHPTINQQRIWRCHWDRGEFFLSLVSMASCTNVWHSAMTLAAKILRGFWDHGRVCGDRSVFVTSHRPAHSSRAHLFSVDRFLHFAFEVFSICPPSTPLHLHVFGFGACQNSG